MDVSRVGLTSTTFSYNLNLRNPRRKDLLPINISLTCYKYLFQSKKKVRKYLAEKKNVNKYVVFNSLY